MLAVYQFSMIYQTFSKDYEPIFLQDFFQRVIL